MPSSRSNVPEWVSRPGCVVELGLGLPPRTGPMTFSQEIAYMVKVGELGRSGIIPTIMVDNPKWLWLYLGEPPTDSADYVWLSGYGPIGVFLGPDGQIRHLRVEMFREATP